jgi:hypothetical protein
MGDVGRGDQVDPLFDDEKHALDPAFDPTTNRVVLLAVKSLRTVFEGNDMDVHIERSEEDAYALEGDPEAGVPEFEFPKTKYRELL